MKELLTISANFVATWTEDKKLLPQVEVTLVMAEPAYSVDAAGEVVRQRETSQCRFSASPRLLRKTAEHLRALADQAEEFLTPEKPKA